ncbi:MAG: molybdopterin converting factor subunit 1 [Candidatus Schekmanbacteria bacterium]|nr:MAG: molybdopterin converting factor subunit 1 [Candidatus Schekmanbacteria bacterium]
MTLKILYFAAIREKLGKKSEEITAREGETVGDLMKRLSEKYEIVAQMEKTLMVAVNKEYRDNSYLLKDGDEVALIPPVSGGQ